MPRRSPDARGDVCSVSVTTGGAGVGVPARATQRRGAEDGGASPTRASSTPGDTSASRVASLSPHGPWARGRAVHAALLPALGTGLRPPARRPQHHPARTVAAFVGGRAPPAITPGVRAHRPPGRHSGRPGAERPWPFLAVFSPNLCSFLRNLALFLDGMFLLLHSLHMTKALGGVSARQHLWVLSVWES